MNEQLELVKELNKRTDEYNKGNPTITDQEWDNMYFKLQELEKEQGVMCEDSPTQSIYYTVSELEKIEHEHPMLSLPKTKEISEVKTFIGDNPYIIMSKMDGLTCSLTYKNGKLVRAETRGNGVIGENILHNAQVIDSIPKEVEYKDKLVIDGEIICKYNDFEEFTSEYANPRNFAAGSVRLLNNKECSKRKLTFVAWDVIEGFDDIDDLYIRLRHIGELNFIVTPFIFESMQTLEEEINEIKEISKELSYPIDGVVIKYRSKKLRDSLPSTLHHAGGAISYKFYDEEYETELIDIDWTMGRTGVLTPTAVFKPIEIDGTIVERASLHNLTVMEDILSLPFENQKVWVVKRNQIIPQIERAIKNNSDFNNKYILNPLNCPVCGERVKEVLSDVSNTRVLMCDNPNCEGRIINKIDHFCGKKGLDIKGLSKKTIEKLIDWGWVSSIEDIFTLDQYKEVWIKKDGFGKSSVEKVLAAIDNSRTCKLESFIAGIGIPLIGAAASKKIVSVFETYEKFREAVDNNYDFESIESFGVELSNNILNYDYKEMDSIAKRLNFEENKTVTTNTNIGKVFCITGSLNRYKNRSELVSVIESIGGKVSSSVSKKTDYLINNDTTSNSAKNIKAKELNIPIISEDEFIKKFI